MNKTNIEFVSYTGAYPNLCSGILTMKVNGKEYEFGHDWLNSLLGKGGDPPNRLPQFWRSGGYCGFDDDWNEEVGQGDWVMSDEVKEDKYPKEIWDCLNDILEVMNQNVPGGCCGGCL